MTNSRKPIFIKSSIASVAMIAFGIYLYSKSLKSKYEFETVKGKIDFISNSFENLNPRDTRYIHIEGFPLVFEVFVGKETGDFSPKFEQLDKLKIGDEIIAYHSGITPLQKNRDERLNKNIEFIDKENKAYYIRGNKNKIGGIFFISIGIFLTIGLIILRRFNKIT
jgi:hypothetical protein